MSSPEEKRQTLLSWYSELNPHTVDLVGDIAGREPFIIHGESLLRHCLTESDVNFDGEDIMQRSASAAWRATANTETDGFQILHAVYAVERFLSNLHKRGCDFDIVFFRNLRHLCVASADENPHKYHLARAIIIQHLTRYAQSSAKGGTRASVLEFESPRSEDFIRYLKPLPIHFILCHEGDDEDDMDTTLLRYMIYEFVARGKNVAVINSLEWKSSKVFAPLISRSTVGLPMLFVKELFDTPPLLLYEYNELPPSSLFVDAVDLSMRERLGILACQLVLKRESANDSVVDEELHQRIQAYLLHLAVIKSCTLLERQHWMDPKNCTLTPEDSDFLAKVIEASLCLMGGKESPAFNDEEADWDLYDCVDGFMFTFVLNKLREREPISQRILDSWKALWSAFSSGTHSTLGHDFPELEAQADQISPSTHSTPSLSALPFSHPILDEFLEGIKLNERKETEDEAANLVFKDLHHWHNTKLLVSHKKPQKLGFFAKKRTQERLADMVTYSASLTNARGKVIDPEIIVNGQGNRKEAKPKAKNGVNQGAQSGGKASAHKAAQEIQQRRELAKRATVVTYWDATCGEIERDPSLINRYLKTVKFLLDRSKEDTQAIGPDIYLYLSNILGKVWAETSSRPQQDPRRGLYLIAMIWNWLQQISAIGASKAVVKAVEELEHRLKLPALPIPIGSQAQALCFKFDYKALKNVPKFIDDPRILQLEHGGPYMERRFDSQPDERVPFDPDAWQRKVLDSIDANNSLLVIAPTSAGKTFISFYAMKKVLEESDDGVLVYVAPTKALVNQIAAEIGARFTKSYGKKEGKSVWGIYTRDYRLQNPTGCQILVTVPHILQIMLLAPVNAKRANSWSRRIKRIIFDEVHCIGKNDEGTVWEQLLLSAPCPIIALSATIGNVVEFRDWLSQVQERKGQKLDFVVHNARFSDLRKFIYEPGERKHFAGFESQKRISVPGLDEGETSCPRFRFVHPIVTITDRNRTALDDLSLEARDCLSLLTCMKEVLSAEQMAEFNVPEIASLPDVIAKSDVIQWEARLKRALRHLMETQSSQFHSIRRALEPQAKQSRRIMKTVNIFKERSIDLFHLILDLHDQDSLPALVFHYDTHGCDFTIKALLEQLESAEEQWKSKSTEWTQKLEQFELWKKSNTKKPKVIVLSRSRDPAGDGAKVSRLDLIREEASFESTPWESFDPDAPLGRFSFADATRMLPSEVEESIKPLQGLVYPWLLDALWRGLGVHHAAMNRQYRQTVEVMFRKGYLRVVIATGTLALGINMPCKTVVFHCDSIFLTAQDYRQASGRAGRRGFDLLGNVVFNGIPRDRVYEIMSARLPGLTGQFPISTTLVLRLLTLLHGTENCDFAATVVQSLLSQTRLYLGGPDAEMAVRHHLRFSIEYLRRQHLLTADGTPVNFAGLVGHLYFTENGVFAFHSLLKGGYFHELCSHVKKNPERVLLEMMLVLSHIFNRIPIRFPERLAKIAHRSSSVIFLPRLPRRAEKLLIQHNQETLSICKGYVQSYISHNLTDKRDRVLPYTKTAVGQEKPSSGVRLPEATQGVRSPFVALSGYGDGFESIHDLCETVRDDVFLEESAIPYIPVWPHDTEVRPNAYIYDFYKHGSLEVLTRDNGIKRGNVWFLLQDFSRTLSSIVSSITTLIDSDDMAGEETLADVTDGEDDAEETEVMANRQGSKRASEKVLDDWADDDNGGEEVEGSTEDSTKDSSSSSSVDSEWGSSSNDGPTPAWQRNGGLKKVLDAFTLLRDDFDTKFRNIWA
ncbi:putative helicase [Cladobotryum mycophilum]|uniref:Helicase n=1 Tax=Cladobotryum mycophilum TaxID=491253 RepID=A0ABR0S4T2_9HYPO